MAENEKDFKIVYIRDFKKAFANKQSYQKTYSPETENDNSEDNKQTLKKQEFQMFKLKDKIFKS